MTFQQQTLKLKDVAIIQNGYAFDSSGFNSDGRGLPVVRIRDVVRGRSETHFNGSYPAECVVGDGDILIGMDGEFNLGIWNGGKALLNQRVCKIAPQTDRVCARYLRYFLPKELKKIEAETPFVTVKHLSSKKISEIQLSLPPLMQQKKISAILDKADAMRQKRQQAIDLLDELLRATFLDMFGDPVSNSKGWATKSMSEVVDDVSYGTAEKASADTRGIPVLRMGNITRDGCIDLSDMKYIDRQTNAPKFLLQENDLLFNRTNSRELVGKTAVWIGQEDMAYAGYLIRVRFRNDVSPHYISAALNSASGKKMLFAMAKPAVNMSNISASDFKRIALAIPPIQLQKRYEEFSKATQQKRLRLKTFQTEADLLFNSLVQRAFNGEL